MTVPIKLNGHFVRWGLDCNLVFAINEYQLGFPDGALFNWDIGKGCNDDEIARTGLVGCGTVNLNDATVSFAFDDIGRKAMSLGNVIDINRLILNHTGQIQQVRVDCEASLIVKLRIGDGGAVNFRVENFNIHEVTIAGMGF